jgi:hypothetical protein
VYPVSRLPTGVASLDLPRVMLVTCGSGKALGQRVAQALICKQGVGGSSPLVSTTEVPGRRPDHLDLPPPKPPVALDVFRVPEEGF